MDNLLITVTNEIEKIIYDLSPTWIKMIVNEDIEKEVIKNITKRIRDKFKELDFFVQTFMNEDEVGGIYINVYYRLEEYGKSYTYHIEPINLKRFFSTVK